MKFSLILSNLGACSDRYMGGGYRDSFTLSQLFERLEQMEDVDGVELVGGWHVTEENMETLLKETQRLNIPVCSIIPDHFGTRVWGKGAFTAPSAEVRQKAVEETDFMAKCARELGCNIVSIWNGQDGYDYPLQADYMAAHKWLEDGIKETAEKNPDIKISLEYKPKEPRNHCFIPNVWSALNISESIGLSNVGVTVDVGHSFEAYENVSEAICAAVEKNRLMHMHINDNYRLWDDDMITGSIHTIEYIEMFYWLKRCGYDGFISIDQYPYREDSLAAAKESIKWMRALEKAADRIDMTKMKEILLRHDAVASTSYVRELIFG